MKLKFRIYSKKRKSYINNESGTHCFDSWAIDPFSGKVVNYVGEWPDDGTEPLYSKNVEKGYYLKGAEFVKESEFIVEQWTGLKDEKGKDIYCGDIVNFNGKLVLIEWNEAEGCFWGGSKSQRYITQYCDMLRVVGNINENPELMEEPIAQI